MPMQPRKQKSGFPKLYRRIQKLRTSSASKRLLKAHKKADDIMTKQLKKEPVYLWSPHYRGRKIYLKEYFEPLDGEPFPDDKYRGYVSGVVVPSTVLSPGDDGKNYGGTWEIPIMYHYGVPGGNFSGKSRYAIKIPVGMVSKVALAEMGSIQEKHKTTLRKTEARLRRFEEGKGVTVGGTRMGIDNDKNIKYATPRGGDWRKIEYPAPVKKLLDEHKLIRAGRRDPLEPTFFITKAMNKAKPRIIKEFDKAGKSMFKELGMGQYR